MGPAPVGGVGAPHDPATLREDIQDGRDRRHPHLARRRQGAHVVQPLIDAVHDAELLQRRRAGVLVESGAQQPVHAGHQLRQLLRNGRRLLPGTLLADSLLHPHPVIV